MKSLYRCAFLLMFLTGCRESPAGSNSIGGQPPDDTASVIMPAETEPLPFSTVAEMLAKKQVPVLCYHHIRDYLPADSETAKPYIVPVKTFREQMQMLKDSGFTTILPDQMVDYLQKNISLPDKPVMITFDDTNLNQYTEALPILEDLGLKGVFFMMTVSIGKEKYMKPVQIKEIADKGHAVELHSWDHKNVKKYEPGDWDIQIIKAAKTLGKITGKEIKHFAYPFGLWKKESLQPLTETGIISAYQLADARDDEYPLYTIRRIIVPGTWSAKTLYSRMLASF